MNELPTGTVTFLFTDIEGSTGLWERYPIEIAAAQARYLQLLRQAVEANGGLLFKTIGDSSASVFSTAGQALKAAVAAQLILTAETWELPTPPGVRMALHTGSAEARNGDYFGQPLNRAARLMAAGHGGQILLSGVTHELTQDRLPELVTLLDLGERRLKDLRRPERVYQVGHPALPAIFPPLRSLDSAEFPNNLPPQLTSFIGREREIADVKEFLSNASLVTLTGAGGSGKSRLSLQVAADLLDQYPDGVYLVELADLTDLALASYAVANALGVREEPGTPIGRTLVDWLKQKRLLLILDNCEHLLTACAEIATNLLRNCPDVRLLTSSREPLGVAGERTYRVPSLSLPELKQSQTLESLSQYEAVILFIERARAVQPDFVITNESAPAVAQICFHLDGIPLAIELAAARTRSLAVQEIHTRLDNRFRLLTGGARNTLPRQQTLRALIDWSYDLLNPGEKALLRRLSVFAGGWTLPAAAAVGTADQRDEWEILDLLTSLVDKSLVIYDDRTPGDHRYRLLESLQQYAQDRLREQGETETTAELAAQWYLDWAVETNSKLTGPEGSIWLSRMEAEHDNLRASLTYYEQLPVASPAAEERAARFELRLVNATAWFWLVRGHYFEGRQWLRKALYRTRNATTDNVRATRASALVLAGNLALSQGDYEEGATCYEESLEISRALGDVAGTAKALGNLGLAAYNRGDFVQARSLMEESLPLRQQSPNPSALAATLNNLGMVADAQADYPAAEAYYTECLLNYRQTGHQQGIAGTLGNLGNVVLLVGQLDRAQSLQEESLTLYRELGDQRGIAAGLCNLGGIAQRRGAYDEACGYLEQSLVICRRLGDRRGISQVCGSLGQVVLAQGDLTAARGAYHELLTICRDLKDQHGIAVGLDDFADLAFRQNELPRAATLRAAAATLRDAIGSPRNSEEQERVEDQLSTLRDALGTASSDAAYEAGRDMTAEQATEFALQVQ